jgi:Fic family protein
MFDSKKPHNLVFLPPKVSLGSAQFADILIKARSEIAELKGYSSGLPNPMLLLSPAIMKEALASSDIENVNTTMIDALQNELFEDSERRQPDKEVIHYREAIMSGFANIKNNPISNRTILCIQENLVQDGRAGYRKTQNYIKNSATGETIYTPPIAAEIPNLISNLAQTINDQDFIVDPLVRIALVHYQFEAIHPFGDGNGRTGRILMVLELIQEELLDFPIIFISGYINKNRREYYRLLLNVTEQGDWDSFIRFILQGFYEQAKATKIVLEQIKTAYFDTKKQVKAKLPKIYSTELMETLFAFPVINPMRLGEKLNVHYTTASRYLHALTRAGFLKNRKIGKYQLFINTELINILHD